MSDEITIEHEYVRCKRLADMTWNEFARLAIGGTDQMKDIIEHPDYEKFYGVISQNGPDFRETSEDSLEAEGFKRIRSWNYVLFNNDKNPLDRSVYVSCSSSFRPEKNKKYGYASRYVIAATLRDRAPLPKP